MLPYVNGQAMTGTISPMHSGMHKKIKNPAAKIFATTNMLQFEDFVDSSINLFLRRIDDLYLDGKICNLASWAGLFVYDTIGELTFSTKYGHLEAGRDIDNIVSDVDKHFQRVSLVSDFSKQPILSY
jgi:hypothetical protein